MMKKLYYLFVMLIAAGIMYSCDNGYADSELLDSPPAVTLEGVPGSIGQGEVITFSADMVDGITEQHLSTPLASYSYSMVDTASLDEVRTGGGTLSGREATVDVNIDLSDAAGTEVPTGVYELIFSAVDTGGNTTTLESLVEVITGCDDDPFSTIGLIGSFNGWSEDVDLTQDGTDPYLWTIADFDLEDGQEVKFRADNAWDDDWGSPAFPSGTAAYKGDNILVTQTGTFDITFNTCTGAYSFVQ